MKIVGQSTVADGAPYIHLGYTAAIPEPKLFGSALAVLIAGVVVGFAIRFGKNKSGFTTINFLRRKNPRLVRVGTIMAIVGGVGLALSFVYGNGTKDLRQKVETWSNAQSILEHIDKSARFGKPIPTDMAALMAATTGTDGFNGDTTDGWRRQMRLVKEIRDGKEGIFVVSAGRDGEFGTSDDLRYSLDEYRETHLFSAASRPAATQPVR
ncbi:MAG: hypothetical protein ACHRHE_17285 [Tepidisphaerales bacterium]